MKIRNIRGFSEVDLDFSRQDGSLAGWTVLAGRNGSGKTTLLRAIALAVAGPDVARAISPSFAGWVTAGTHEAEVRVYLESLSDSELLPTWAGLTWQSAREDDEPSLKSTTTQHFLHSGFKSREPYDVVFFYRQSDWEEVAHIARKLRTHGLRPWLDRWETRPGERIRDVLEVATDLNVPVAIFIGAEGHPISSVYLRALLDIVKAKGTLLIPVLLKSAKANSQGLPIALAELSLVDFNQTETDAIQRLIWGITGKAPTSTEATIEQIPGGFLSAYGPYRRLTGHAVDAQRLMEGPAPIARLVSLFREDASLVECVTWLREIYLQRLESKPGAAELEAAVLSLLNDGLLPDGVRLEKIDSQGIWTSHKGILLPLEQLSDGYRTTAAFVMDIVRQLYRCFGELELTPAADLEGTYQRVLHAGVVLVDEVDLHLHISWQKRIGFWLKRHFPNIQFIVTTHSPFVSQAADSRGLIRLPAPGEDRPVEHVSEALYNTVVNGSIDDAVLTELFGLETPYSEPAERLREDVARLEAKLQAGKASDKDRRKLQELRGRLPQNLSTDVEQALRKLAAER